MNFQLLKSGVEVFLIYLVIIHHTGVSPPFLADINTTRCIRETPNIVGDPTHPSHFYPPAIRACRP